MDCSAIPTTVIPSPPLVSPNFRELSYTSLNARYEFLKHSNQSLLTVIGGNLIESLHSLADSLVKVQGLLDAFCQESMTASSEGRPTTTATDSGFEIVHRVIAPQFKTLVERVTLELVPDFISSLQSDCILPLQEILSSTKEVKRAQQYRQETYLARETIAELLSKPDQDPHQMEARVSALHQHHLSFHLADNKCRQVIKTVVDRSEYDTPTVVAYFLQNLSQFVMKLNCSFSAIDPHHSRKTISERSSISSIQSEKSGPVRAVSEENQSATKEGNSEEKVPCVKCVDTISVNDFFYQIDQITNPQ